MSNVDIHVDRQTDGRTENRTPISHSATSRCDKNEKHINFIYTCTIKKLISPNSIRSIMKLKSIIKGSMVYTRYANSLIGETKKISLNFVFLDIKSLVFQASCICHPIFILVMIWCFTSFNIINPFTPEFLTWTLL